MGNVVDPNLLVDAYGADPVRYFLLKEIPFGGDGNFSHDAFMTRFNADLANDYGNLAYRALSMSEKWLGGVVPELTPSTPRDEALEALARETLTAYGEQLEALKFSDAFETLWTLVRAGNKYIDDEEPWKLRKTDPERLKGVMRRCMEICRIAAVLTAPIMPDKSAQMLRSLGADGLRFEKLDTFDGLTAGAAFDKGDPLFPRMQELPESIVKTREASLAAADAAQAPSGKKQKKAKKGSSKKKEPAEASAGLITFEDFQRVSLRAGRVIAAEKHPKADRLLVLKVDLGEDTPRQIVAGIADRYSPEELVGQSVVAVANLKPAKLRGVESQGMLLAAGAGAVEALVTLSGDVAPGTVVR